MAASLYVTLCWILSTVHIQMQMNDQLRTPATLFPRKEPPVRIG